MRANARSSTSASRVLVVAHYYPPHVGGLEVVAKEVAHELTSRGLSVEVLTSALGAPAGLTVEDGVRVRRISAWGGLEQRIGVPFPFFSPALLWHTWRGVRKADWVQLHDMLYLSSWVAALCCWLTRTPYLVTRHVAFVAHPSRIVRVVQRIVEHSVGGAVLRRAKQVLAINEFIADDVRSNHPKSSVAVLRNGVNTDLFRPAGPDEKEQLRAKFGLPAELALVLFVGRFVPKKGFADVLGAADPQGRYGLVFVGGELDDAPAGCWFLGSRTQAEVAQLYRAADVFVSASVGEGPMTVIEAMASGVPAVVRDDAAHRSLGLHGGGFVPCDVAPAGLRSTLLELLADPRGLSQRGVAAAHEARARSSWQHHVDRLLEHATSPSRPPDRPVTRVAVVAAHFPPDLGGVEQYAAQLVRTLAAHPDFEPVVIASSRSRRRSLEDFAGTPVVRLATWLRLSNTPVNPAWLWQVRRELRRRRIDVVWAHAPVPGLPDLAVLGGGRPSLLTYHAGSLLKGTGGPVDAVLTAYQRWVLPRVFRGADQVVAVSPTAAAVARTTCLIPPGVDTSLFRPATPVFQPDAATSSKPPPSLLYVGRLETTSAWKGVDVLLAAMALLRGSHPQLRLRLVGDGDAVEDLRRVAEKLGIAANLDFVGARHGDELVAEYQRCVALVLPSTTDAESFGMTLIEAMACGRPVVASRIGGIPFVVRDGVDGLLVAPGDAAKLAAALDRIITEPTLGASLGQAGRRAATDRWDWKRRDEQMLSLLVDLVGRGFPGQ